MLPGPLTPPSPAGVAPRPPRRPAVATVAGILLVAVGVLGSLVWLGAVSPLGFIRFPVIDGDRTLTFRDAGAYVVFEEFPGAAGDRLPSPLDITVIDHTGNDVPVTPLTRPGAPTPVHPYDLPGFEGRAVAELTVPRSGRYLVRVRIREVGRYAPEEYTAVPSADLAVAREAAVHWVAHPAVGVLVGPVPIAAGVVVLVVGRRRRAARASHRTAGSAETVR
jgi:hypothetical protein